jgi:ZIP family zinc transporter
MPLIAKIMLVTALAGIGGTGLGGLVGAVFKKDSQKTVSLLLSFAGGVMLSLICFDLLSEAIHPGGVTGNIVDLCIVVASLLAGYFIVYLLNLAIDRHTEKEVDHIDANHPRTADDLGELIHSKHLDVHKKKNSGLFIAGVVMACAIALHNLPEGMVIGASYALDSSSIMSGSGFIMAVLIGLHNIPEGMAVSVPLISGGEKRWKAVLLTALSGVPTVIGAMLGYYLGILNDLSLSIALSFASGAMLYVVFGELLPEAILMWRSKVPAFATLVGMIVGIFIIFA